MRQQKQVERDCIRLSKMLLQPDSNAGIQETEIQEAMLQEDELQFEIS